MAAEPISKREGFGKCIEQLACYSRDVIFPDGIH
jgi:hypothetical protein